MAWQSEYQQDLVKRGKDFANTGYTPFGQNTTAAANPWQTSSWERTYNRGMQGAEEVGAARDQLTGTIQGQGFQSNPFLQQDNPYLQSTIDSTLGDITRNYNLGTKPNMETAMIRSGSFGNAGLQQMQGEQQRSLQQELGRAASNLRFGDYQQRSQLYENERNRQMQGTLQAPTFANVDYTDLQAMQQAGNAAQGQDQNELTSDYNQYLDAREWPFKTFNSYASALNASPQQQALPQANKGANALGGALAGASLGSAIGIGSGWGAGLGGLLGLFSDARLKTDITRCGTLDNGLPVYTYRYINDPTSTYHMGVMAQEAKQVVPQAVNTDASGYMRVRYDMIG